MRTRATLAPTAREGVILEQIADTERVEIGGPVQRTEFSQPVEDAWRS
ncbi:MAG: hypothetical protein ABR992_11355 [Solirubrobacteraceae bacterium]